MRCVFRYKTDKTTEGKHKFVECESVKEGELLFKNSTENIIKAWITYFDGWHNITKKILK